MRGYVLVGCSALAIACGGGDKPVKKPKPKKDDTEAVKPETEEDRAAKRLEEAQKIVPADSKCLPLALKEEEAPRLELAAIGPDAIVCAIDQLEERMLGPVGCWKIDLSSGALTYKEPEPLPGRGFTVRMHENCAWGYCMPDDVKAPGNVAHIAWDLEGKKVAVLVANDVYLFDASTKAQESSFSIRGDKGVVGDATNVHLVGPHVIVEGGEGANTGVWVFKADGTAVGPLMALGGKDEKPLSTHKGSFSILDKGHVAVSEHGMETLTTYELDSGKRAKLVRNAKKPACKPAELEAFWKDGDKVTDKCKGSIEALSGHLIGATAVSGAKNFLVMFRGDRLGELGVLDSKSLAEKKVIKMPWCTGDEGGGGSAKSEKKSGGKAESSDEEEDDEGDAKKDAKKDGAKKGGTRGQSADPEEGGE